MEANSGMEVASNGILVKHCWLSETVRKWDWK